MGSQASVLGAASMAGFVAAACSLPFDFVKTRMQEMAPNPDGSFPYKGFADCAMQTARKEGLPAFYTGFPTYCVRSAALPCKYFSHIQMMNDMPIAEMLKKREILFWTSHLDV